VRQLDGAMLAVRPRLAWCSSCHAAQVLYLLRLGDAAVGGGAVLVAKASGHGCRIIAAELPGRPQASPLGDAMQAHAAAVVAHRRWFTRPVEPWALIAVFVHGLLLATAPHGLIGNAVLRPRIGDTASVTATARAPPATPRAARRRRCSP
jgi:hypothetical protein